VIGTTVTVMLTVYQSLATGQTGLVILFDIFFLRHLPPIPLLSWVMCPLPCLHVALQLYHNFGTIHPHAAQLHTKDSAQKIT